MSTIEDKYKSALKTDLAGLAENTARKFSFTLKSIGAEYVHGKLYDAALNVAISDRKYFPSQFFGTPMWDNLILDTEGEKLRIDMVLITVSMSKNIIKTPVQGMSGTVKEFISDGDYAISIKGGLFSIDNNYPEQDVIKFLKILKKKQSIRISSHFLQLFSITDIVIDNYKMDAKEGQGNAQFFEISAISDTPSELIFNDNVI